MSDEERGGKSYNFQSKTVKIILKILLFLGILAFGFFLIRFIGFQFSLFVVIIIILISILSGKWIKKHPLLGFILFLILIVLILFIVATTLLTSIGILSESQYRGFSAAVSESWFGLRNFNFNPFGQWRDFQDRQVAIATGEHFTGQVEESKDDKDLGLQLERLESFSTELKEGQEAIFWVTLKGKTLGDTPIQGIIGCNASDGDENRLTGLRDYNIYSYEMNEYECRFSSLPGGKSVKISFWTQYSFKTLGYKKAYFIDQERLRTLRSLNLDPLREAGITDRNPRSIYTQGPISIGIGTSDFLPIPVSNVGDRIFILGITLETRPMWKGEISRINDLEVQIHNSLGLNLQDCDHNFEMISDSNCVQRCQGNEECIMQCNEYSFYRLSDNELMNIENIKNFRTFRCPVILNSKNDLLGNNPISTKYVRVIADYDFKTYIDRIFHIRKSEET